MSNALTIIPESDLMESEKNAVQEYIESGLPGIADINETQLYRMVDLYMGGSTYTQISVILRVKKTIVLYLAHSNNWFLAKREYLNEIQEKMRNRVIDSKLRNQEFTLLVVQAYQKKITEQLTKFLSTNDPAHMEEVDLKELGQLMKVIEMVNGLDETGKDKQGKTPAIGLNIGDGVSIQKTGDNTVSITPNRANIGDMLRGIADSQREQQKIKDELSVKPKPDIESDNKGVKNEDQ